MRIFGNGLNYLKIQRKSFDPSITLILMEFYRNFKTKLMPIESSSVGVHALKLKVKGEEIQYFLTKICSSGTGVVD